MAKRKERVAPPLRLLPEYAGLSVNQVLIDALQAEIDRARKDDEFMTLLNALVERDKEILDRLAE